MSQVIGHSVLKIKDKYKNNNLKKTFTGSVWGKKRRKYGRRNLMDELSLKWLNG